MSEVLLEPEAALEPEEVVACAVAVPANTPVVWRICLTSGGGDSTVLAHRCLDLYDELVHIDTGTALPGVREFVGEFAASLGKQLRVVEAGDAYRELVLGRGDWKERYKKYRYVAESIDGYRRRIKAESKQVANPRAWRMERGYHLLPLGFPGPPGHKFAYQRLKERSLEVVLRDVKAEYGNGLREQRVVLLSGVRMDESERRKMTGAAQGYWERRGNQLWVNPLLDWSNERMREYRADHALPISDATALTHRSGECNCLAFVAPGERDFLIQMYPDWYAEKILPIEQEGEALGLERSRWGWADKESTSGLENTGPMCRSCDLRVHEKQEVLF